MERILKLRPSSNVHEARYDPDTETLTLKLNDGVWSHFGVSPEKAEAFEAADSHGQHYHKHFRGQHEVKRVK